MGKNINHSLIFNLLNKSSQIIRFSFVGAFCLGFNTLILYVLMEFGHLHYLLSTIIAFFFSNLLGFFLNKYYTFRALKTSIWKELYKYYAVMTSSFIANLLLMVILVDLFKLWAIYASLLVAIILYIYNYLMHKNWSFRMKRASQKVKIR